MLWWDAEQLAVLAASIERARSGSPTVLVVAGSAGTGKTSLLDELLRQTSDFRVFIADALERRRAPFDVLLQWGVSPPEPGGDGFGDPFVAAQGLRELLDRDGQARPVLLRLDDLHWADPESIETLLWLLRRASGDRLLVAVGTRPLPADTHPGWQRWIAGAEPAAMVTLNGLSAENAAALVAQVRPGLPAEVTERLRQHTGGNPLYLTALLNEYEGAELAQMRILPAPTEFAQLLAARVARLSPASIALIRAMAALGSGWAPLPDVAAVAEVDDAGAAISELLEDDLVQLRAPLGTVSLRTTHALIRAAIYQQIPLTERRGLHVRAARVVMDRAEQLEHRLAAAEQYDDELAAEMDAYAGELYQQQSFRLAAQFLRWSSTLTRDPIHRERRWLDSLFASVMALDVAAVHAEQEQVARAGDQARRASVLAGLAIWERRFHDGIAILEPIEAILDDTVDRSVRYRIEVLLAWARLCVGHAPELIRAILDRAAAVRVPDAGVDGSELVTAGGTDVRLDGFSAVMNSAWLSPVPARPADTPMALTKQLIWRGTIRTRFGFIDDGAEDLTEGTRRIQNGVTNFGRGAFHAFLAIDQWLRGDWSHARLTARLALDASGQFSHPMVLALTALPAIADGREEQAAQLMARSQAILERAPWFDACQLLTTSRVVALHASGSDAERATFVSSLRGTPFEVPVLTNTGVMLRLHLGLAAVWAGETELVLDCVRSLRAEPVRPGWLEAATLWLDGLLAQRQDAPEQAWAHFAAARATGELDQLPLYHAHLLTDSARAGQQLDRPAAARELATAARALYARLDATPYLARLDALERSDADRGVTSAAAAARPLKVRFELTDREQDVLTLVTAGMSYAQISRELFITQSTVSYHLSNIYDKTGIRRRAQLTELFRREPHAFGVAASG